MAHILLMTRLSKAPVFFQNGSVSNDNTTMRKGDSDGPENSHLSLDTSKCPHHHKSHVRESLQHRLQTNQIQKTTMPCSHWQHPSNLDAKQEKQTWWDNCYSLINPKLDPSSVTLTAFAHYRKGRLSITGLFRGCPRRKKCFFPRV